MGEEKYFDVWVKAKLPLCLSFSTSGTSKSAVKKDQETVETALDELMAAVLNMALREQEELRELLRPTVRIFQSDPS